MFAPVGATFTRRSFERIEVQNMTFGAGEIVSTYEECVFDGAKLKFGPAGFARLINCSFRNVDMYRLECDSVDIIECVFSGRLRGGSIHGAVPGWKRNAAGHERNTITGNDFSGVRMTGFYFQSGVDLSAQRLPQSPDYLYLTDGPVAAAAAREALAECPESLREGIGMVDRLVEQGQQQIWLRKKELFPTHREAINWLLEFWDKGGYATPPP